MHLPVDPDVERAESELRRGLVLFAVAWTGMVVTLVLAVAR